VYRAIDRVAGIQTTLVGYSLQAATAGKDALGEVTVQVRDNGNVYVGRGTSTDIVEASARAYLQAINKILHDRALRAGAEQQTGATVQAGQQAGA